MTIPSFVFGGYIGKTYEQLQKERDAYLRALQQRQMVTDPVAAASYLGAQLHNLLGAAFTSARLGQMDKEGQGLFQQLMDEIAGGSAAPEVQPASFPGTATAKQASVAPLPKDMQARAREMAQYLVKKGFTPAQAAGIVGNLIAESSLNPVAVNKKSGAFGLAQWLGKRKKELQVFAGAQGKDCWRDWRTQLDFLTWELASRERRAWERLSAAKDPKSAAEAFMHFERAEGYKPNDVTGMALYPQRISYAQQVISLLGDSATPKEIAAATGQSPRVVAANMGVGQNTRVNLNDAPTRRVATYAAAGMSPQEAQAAQDGADIAQLSKALATLPPLPPKPTITPPEKRREAVERLVRVLQRIQMSPVLSPDRKATLKQAITVKLQALQQQFQTEDMQLKHWNQLAMERERTRLAIRKELAQKLFEARLKPLLVGPGSVVFDPITRRPIFRAPEKKTELERALKEYNEQRRQMGLPPLTLYEAMKELRQAGATKVNVNTAEQADQALRKEVLRGIGKTWQQDLEQARTMTAIRPKVQMLEELANSMRTGSISGQVKKWLGEYGVSAPADLFLRLSRELLPVLKQPGMGALTESEYKMIEAVLPQLTSRPEVNKIIISALKKRIELAKARERVLKDMAFGKLTAEEARLALDALDNEPLLDEEARSLLRQLTGASEQQAALEAPYARQQKPQKRQNFQSVPLPKGIDPELWKYMTPEERKAFMEIPK